MDGTVNVNTYKTTRNCLVKMLHSSYSTILAVMQLDRQIFSVFFISSLVSIRQI